MVKVYYEKNGKADLIATFESEDIYDLCFATLETHALLFGFVMTESIEGA